MEPAPEDIAKLAYRFYIEDGKPQGLAEEHWNRAEEFLRHPENHSDENLLAVPSEPEINRALDEKAQVLDQDLPSDPRSGNNAVHQRIELVIEKKEIATVRKTLQALPGVERLEADSKSGRIAIHFDARRTNPAAIHEAILSERQEAAYRTNE